MAVAFHPDFEYAAVAVGDEVWILAKELVAPCLQLFGIDEYTLLATFSAAGLEGKRCRHPFMERDSLMVLADYVTADSGTGCVHTAPGHGADDYLTGLRYDLDILSPVDDEGIFHGGRRQVCGAADPAGQRRIVADMAAEGSLVKEMAIRHSYPHCWRCKEPVMYRATAQWFISMDNLHLRDKALQAIKEATWTPYWGQQRIYGMVESRPDWCLSRQRTWGVPVTVLSCVDCGEILKNEAVCARIDQLFIKEGADAWFKHEADFVPEDVACSCGGREFKKESDILDVWFDSGTSHAAVLEERPELRSPADLYLEGSDQHRGWFQSSLLTSVGTRGRAPYKGVLTHGYVVDGQGKKMSKSVGNVVAPQEVIDQYGPRSCASGWPVKIIRTMSRFPMKSSGMSPTPIVRYATPCAFCLSNLYDFDPGSALRLGTLVTGATFRANGPLRYSRWRVALDEPHSLLYCRRGVECAAPTW
jgi:isoleucyl-tRNA synthetase